MQLGNFRSRPVSPSAANAPSLPLRLKTSGRVTTYARSPQRKQPSARPFIPCGRLFLQALASCLLGTYAFSLAMMRSATFLPLSSMPPKIGPMRGVPDTALAAIPQT